MTACCFQALKGLANIVREMPGECEAARVVLSKLWHVLLMPFGTQLFSGYGFLALAAFSLNPLQLLRYFLFYRSATKWEYIELIVEFCRASPDVSNRGTESVCLDNRVTQC